MKKFLSILSCFAIILLASSTLLACGRSDEPTLKFDENQANISMVVSATEDKITFDISSEEEKVGDANVSLIGMKAYEYFEADQYKGLSTSVVTEDECLPLTTYKLGTDASFEMNRFVDGYDNLYNKYYLVHDGKILKGPVYATEIAALSNAQPVLDIKSKKGIIGEIVQGYSALNASHVVLNFPIQNLIFPNEYFEGDEKVDFEPASSSLAIEFTSNGKKFYFNKSVVENFDNQVKSYYDLGADITAIIYAANQNIADENFPQKMTYDCSTEGAIILGLNTDNSYGFEYYIAMMEFLSQRYSTQNLEHGFISTYVIGNEVDYARDYFRISNNHAPFNTFMEEYSRLLRLSNLAVKKSHASVKVSTSFTHMWAEQGYTFQDDAVKAYAPKQMVDWLNTKTKMEGDYDWGIAPHCYCFTLSTTRVFEYDTYEGRFKKGMTNDFNTSTITYSNLEILDLYLNQDFLKFNGQPRSVYLTESGVSSSGYYGDNKKQDDDDLAQKIQAGVIAATWYKVSQLDSIKYYSYYRLNDGITEGENLTLGLATSLGERKLSFEVWKNIDTKYSFNYANPYLKYVKYYDEDFNLQSVDNGGIKSYLDVLDIFGTGYDFSNFDYSKAMPIQDVPTIDEFEDEIDMSGVYFVGANRLYDGEDDVTISASLKGELPDGVTYKYFDEEGNELEQPTLTGKDSKEITAVFYKDGQEVAKRRAILSAGRLTTNKSIYKLGEKIYFTTDRRDGDSLALSPDSWVGLYRSQDDVIGEASFYWTYVNKTADTQWLRSISLLDCTENKPLAAGQYTLYWFKNYDASYDTVVDKLNITVVDDEIEGNVDLSNVKFTDQEFVQTGEPITMQIQGDLPAGVTVEYLNGTQSEAGQHQVCAVFKDANGVELERRYAVMSISEMQHDNLELNKTTYKYGEDVLLTARAPGESAEKTWWVGVYRGTRQETDDFSTLCLGYYYVKDSEHGHISGEQVNLRTACSVAGGFEVGDYTIVLFETSVYDQVNMILHFTVEPISGVSLELIGDTDGVFEHGQEIKAKVTYPEDLPNFEHYWVAIYKVGQDASSIIYYYIKNYASGQECILQNQIIQAYWNPTNSGDYTVAELQSSYPGWSFTLPVGHYELRLLAGEDNVAGGYPIYATIPFEVRGNSTLSLENPENNTFTAGDKVVVNFHSVYYLPGVTNNTYHSFGYCWLGVYGEGQPVGGTVYKLFEYLKTFPDGRMTIDTTGWAPGTYTIALFADGLYTLDTTVQPITITIV